jgi:hypothetical protein
MRQRIDDPHGLALSHRPPLPGVQIDHDSPPIRSYRMSRRVDRDGNRVSIGVSMLTTESTEGPGKRKRGSPSVIFRDFRGCRAEIFVPWSRPGGCAAGSRGSQAQAWFVVFSAACSS